MPAWIDALLSGPFLPPQLRTSPSTDPESPEKLLFFLERAWGHNHDLITELITLGKWQHAIWIIRALLEPTFEYPPNASQTVFEGTKYTALTDTREDPGRNFINDGGIPSPAIAGRSGLWTITVPEMKRDIERRRRGFGLVLGSLAGMVFRAGEEIPGGQHRLGSQHTDLLPTMRQILAYCHTTSLMPEALYAVDRYPRLHMLQSRILASLADAAWRAKEAAVADEAAKLGIIGEHRGMEVPRARYAPSVWGSGTKDISARPPVETNGLASWTPYAEREVWLELIFAIIVEAGYGNIGASIIHYMVNMAFNKVPNNTWSFTDYFALHPHEYTYSAISHFHNEPSSRTTQDFPGLPGHSLRPPQLTTNPLTLPDWILPAVIDAVVDSTAEGRGLEPMFRSIVSYARSLPMRRETMLRLLRHPALVWGKNAEMMEVGAGLLWEFGDRWKAADMYYTSLMLYIEADNIIGALRVWRDGAEKSRLLRKVPGTVVGAYIKFLVQSRKLGYAWNLLRRRPEWKEAQMGIQVGIEEPVVSEREYAFPTIAPALLALAVESRSLKLYLAVTGAVEMGRQKGRWVTKETYTSVMNAHLAFGEIGNARDVLVDMRSDGIQPDGVNVAILLRHEFERDPEAGFRLAESESGTRPEWSGTAPSSVPITTKGLGGEREGAAEGKTKKTATMSRDAWLTVLDYAVSAGYRSRTKWALDSLGIEMATGVGLDSIAFNILLRGVAKREGCRKAMEMCHRYHTRGEERADGEVVGNALSFRTVLHCAIRELMQIKRVETISEEDVTKIMQRGTKGKGKVAGIAKQVERKRRKKGEKKVTETAKQVERKRREVEDVIAWCWDELRHSGMEIGDVVKTVRTWLWLGPKEKSK